MKDPGVLIEIYKDTC